MGKNKYLWLLVLVLAFGLLASGCGDTGAADKDQNGQDEVKTSWELIQEKGEMTVGLDDTFRPMGFRDEQNNLVGFDIDMGKELEKHLGVAIKWIPTDWTGVTGSLNAKKFDVVINGMSITETRLKEIDFSIPYVNASIGLVVKKGNDEIKTRDDLKGKTVATQGGSSGFEACQDLIKDGILDEANLKQYNQYPEAFLDLELGRSDVIVVDLTTAEDYVASKPDVYQIVEEPLVADLYAVGIRKDDQDLKKAIDDALLAMMEDGTLADISKKWFDGKDMIAYPEQ